MGPWVHAWVHAGNHHAQGPSKSPSLSLLLYGHTDPAVTVVVLGIAPPPPHHILPSAPHPIPPKVFTWAGMSCLAAFGFFIPKKIPAHQLLPLAIGYIGYIVLCNLSLNLNSVGFYQACPSLWGGRT